MCRTWPFGFTTCIWHSQFGLLLFQLHFLLSCLGRISWLFLVLILLYHTYPIIGGAFHGSFSSVTLPFSHPPSWILGPRNGCLLCCHSWVLTKYYVNLLLSHCSCYTQMLVWVGCLSLSELWRGVRLTASKLLEQLGVIFEVGALKKQQVQLSRTFLHMGLYRRSEVKEELGLLSLFPGKQARLTWAWLRLLQPLSVLLPFQPLS